MGPPPLRGAHLPGLHSYYSDTHTPAAIPGRWAGEARGPRLSGVSPGSERGVLESESEVPDSRVPFAALSPASGTALIFACMAMIPGERTGEARGLHLPELDSFFTLIPIPRLRSPEGGPGYSPGDPPIRGLAGLGAALPGWGARRAGAR